MDISIETKLLFPTFNITPYTFSNTLDIRNSTRKIRLCIYIKYKVGYIHTPFKLGKKREERGLDVTNIPKSWVKGVAWCVQKGCGGYAGHPSGWHGWQIRDPINKAFISGRNVTIANPPEMDANQGPPPVRSFIYLAKDKGQPSAGERIRWKAKCDSLPREKRDVGGGGGMKIRWCCCCHRAYKQFLGQILDYRGVFRKSVFVKLSVWRKSGFLNVEGIGWVGERFGIAWMEMDFNLYNQIV